MVMTGHLACRQMIPFLIFNLGDDMNRSSPASMVAGDIMVTKLITLSPETDVFEGIETLVRHRISGAPVVDDEGNLVGVFSEKSCMQVLIDAAYDGMPTNRVRAFMDSNPLTVDEKTCFLTIAQIFLNQPRRRLPVVEGVRLVGQVSRRDVIKAAANYFAISVDHPSRLLYLSALREMTDPPVV